MSKIKVNMPVLLDELRRGIEATDRRIGRRDQREIIASIIGIVLFALMAWYIPYTWTKVACMLGVGWFGYVIYRLKNTSKDREPDPSRALWKQLEQRKQYLRRQANMLNNVLYWYILPPFIINVLFVFGVGTEDLWDSPVSSMMPYALWEKAFMLGVVFLLYAYITWINRKAARTYYPPLIEEIEEIQNELMRQE